MTDIAPEAQAALDDFDVVAWLDDSINAESTITVYRDGTTLLELQELAEVAEEATRKAKQSSEAKLSIADDYADTAQEAVEAAEDARERLAKSGLTFKLRSVGTETRDVLLKKLARDKRFKEVEETEDQPGVPGGERHPDFQRVYQHELMSKAIVSVSTADGKVDSKPWTPERVESLHRLPLNEYTRLWNKVYEIHYAQYDIDRMVDLDFSSRL